MAGANRTSTGVARSCAWCPCIPDNCAATLCTDEAAAPPVERLRNLAPACEPAAPATAKAAARANASETRAARRRMGKT